MKMIFLKTVNKIDPSAKGLYKVRGDLVKVNGEIDLENLKGKYFIMYDKEKGLVALLHKVSGLYSKYRNIRIKNGVIDMVVPKEKFESEVFEHLKKTFLMRRATIEDIKEIVNVLVSKGGRFSYSVEYILSEGEEIPHSLIVTDEVGYIFIKQKLNSVEHDVKKKEKKYAIFIPINLKG